MRFLSVVLHDVVDERATLDADSMTTSDLVAFFEYLVSNHWHALTLDEIDRARRGDAVLPEQSILITIDDAYASDYTRVYPLLLAYRMPALLARRGRMDRGGRRPGRLEALTWKQAREMQKSGLVEFVSHGYALHTAIRGNPQGSMLPAFAYRLFDPVRGYEQEDGYRDRVTEDLQRSIAVMTRELGTAPRAIAWPYGRYTRIVDRGGRRGRVSLRPHVRPGAGRCEPPDDDRALLTLHRIARCRPSSSNLRVERHAAADTAARAAARVELYRPDPAETERLLGAAIERVRTMGATAIVMEGVETGPDGRLAAWFPTTHLPVRADVYLRFAWQFQTRAGVRVYGRIPVVGAREATGSDEATMASSATSESSPRWTAFCSRGQPTITAGGDAGAGRGGTPGSAATPSTWRPFPPKARLAFACFRAVKTRLPGLLLVVMTDEIDPRGPAVAADLTLVRTHRQPRDAERLASRMEAAGWLRGESSRRVGLWIESGTPPARARSLAITRDVPAARRDDRRLGGATTRSAISPKASAIAPGRVRQHLPGEVLTRCGTT